MGLLAFVLVPLAACAVADPDLATLTGPESWGGRKAHPAVVNPVTGQDPANVLSLRGEWEFYTTPEFGRSHPWTKYRWITDPKPWARTIRVPGCWEAQGVGEPGEGKCWNILGDNNAKALRHVYTGVGRYRRRVTVPAAWKGRRIWLKVGGAKSVGWFFVWTNAVACVDSFCGTYKYDITDLVTPGKETVIVAQVRNDVPSRKGQVSATHRWGGLYRDVELEATPPEAWIDDAWVRGDFDRRLAEVHVEVGTSEKTGGEKRWTKDGLILRATVENEVAEIPLFNLQPSTSNLQPSTSNLFLPLRRFRAWSPESPNLYTAKVELLERVAATGEGADLARRRGGAEKVLQTRFERFGVRKIEVRGKELFLNGKPFFVRGFGDDHVYPIEGLTPADADVHRRHLAIARAAGFNAVRLHTHTEVPEYFEAADELGILVEAELPYYNDEPTEGQTFDPVRDVTELYRHYRRHPSFAVYSMGNEGTFGVRQDRALHRYVKSMDPDRIKINQDSNLPQINPPESSDCASGPLKVWPRGSYDPDRPFVCHEYLNLGSKTDSRLEGRYAGIWQPPLTRAARADWLAKYGLDLAWGDRLQNAAHGLQRLYQKRGVESARTDPNCDGYSFWTIVDVVVANLGTYSAQGLFTPFWTQKENGASPAEFAVFNSPVGVFLDVEPAARIFVAGETVRATARLANYGDGPLEAATLAWTLAADGKTLVRGESSVGDQPLGPVREIAPFSFAAPAVPRAVRATLSLAVSSGGRRAAANAWDCWIFPPRDGSRLAIADAFAKALAGRYAGALPEARAAEADLVLAPYASLLATNALARGQKVITLANCAGEPNVSLGWWWMGDQIGTALLDHPALAGLPHQGLLNELLFRILKKGAKLPLPGVRKEDLIVVGEGGDACYGYLAEPRPEKGAALNVFGLDVLSPTPEGAALLDGLIDYMRR